MSKQRISYIRTEDMDKDMQKEMHRCQVEGTPTTASMAPGFEDTDSLKKTKSKDDYWANP